MRFCVLMLTTLLAHPRAYADDAPTFERDVALILRTHCWSCHGANERFKGDLDLRQPARLLRGGDTGPAIVPGKPDASLLFKRIRDGEMPPADTKVPEAERETIRRWIAAGAPTNDDKTAAAETPLWSLQPVKRPSVPRTDTSLVRIRSMPFS